LSFSDEGVFKEKGILVDARQKKKKMTKKEPRFIVIAKKKRDFEKGGGNELSKFWHPPRKEIFRRKIRL